MNPPHFWLVAPCLRGSITLPPPRALILIACERPSSIAIRGLPASLARASRQGHASSKIPCSWQPIVVTPFHWAMQPCWWMKPCQMPWWSRPKGSWQAAAFRGSPVGFWAWRSNPTTMIGGSRWLLSFASCFFGKVPRCGVQMSTCNGKASCLCLSFWHMARSYSWGAHMQSIKISASELIRSFTTAGASLQSLS